MYREYRAKSAKSCRGQTSSNLENVKLTYFNMKGRAELIRLLLAQGGVPYEDNRITQEEWATLKQDTPWGGLPVLEIDGKIISQSRTVARFVASEIGLAGRDSNEKAEADAIVDANADLEPKIVAAMYENDPDKKMEAFTQLVTETIPDFLTKIQNVLEQNNSGDGFVVGDELTWADLCMYNTFSNLMAISQKDDMLSSWPTLDAHYHRIGDIPKIKTWVETRPQTAM